MRILLALVTAASAVAQFPPGYIDPEPILRDATQAIGADRLQCVTISGNGYAGTVGQQRESGWNIDWPRTDLTNYSRTMNWSAGTMVETFERKPGMNPASWKWGLGWFGGTPLQQHPRQLFAVSGNHAWHIDGNTTPVALPPAEAERARVEMWINPHGFLKAARLPGANPRAAWRWELGEAGRDGHTTQPERVRIVSITLFGKYRVDATVNKENLLQRIHTWVPDPVLGDTNYEHEFTNDAYKDLGNGIRFPTTWHHHEGWDDNFGAQAVTAGHNGFGGTFDRIQANACPAAIEVPAGVLNARFNDEKVEALKLAEGVYLLGGGSHNSVAVEFRDFIAIVEAPLHERRSLAVIEEAVRLIPGKPIRFLVNTHQHFDHIGGLRTYMHIGATIVTHWKNFAFYTRDVLNYVPRTLEPDMLALWPPTEVAEGYQYETVRENYVITDGTRNLHATYVQPLQHAEGMLMVHLPKEKLAIEADLLDGRRDGPLTPENRILREHMRRIGAEGFTIVPIHGSPVAWDDFARRFR